MCACLLGRYPFGVYECPERFACLASHGVCLGQVEQEAALALGRTAGRIDLVP
jgi:hypothetical protein